MVLTMKMAKLYSFSPAASRAYWTDFWGKQEHGGECRYINVMILMQQGVFVALRDEVAFQG